MNCFLTANQPRSSSSIMLCTKPLDEKWNKMHHVSLLRCWWPGYMQKRKKTSLQIYIFSALPALSTYFIFIHLCFYWMLFNSQKIHSFHRNKEGGGRGSGKLSMLKQRIIIIFIWMRSKSGKESWAVELREHHFQGARCWHRQRITFFHDHFPAARTKFFTLKQIEASFFSCRWSLFLLRILTLTEAKLVVVVNFFLFLQFNRHFYNCYNFTMFKLSQ